MHCLLDRVGPMLDSRGVAVPPVCDPRHIAGSIHIWCGFTGAVADEAVIDREAASFEPFRVWRHADADNHHVGVDP